MPEIKRRGSQPQDARLFGPDALPPLRQAVADLSWLYTHGYAETSSLKLVGDRHRLVLRQRQAVARCACSDQARADREARRLPVGNLRDKVVAIDGFNLIITLETALNGGVLIKGRDGCVRDLASLHGNYRVLDETAEVLAMIHRGLERLRPAAVQWWLDQPVSNSGQIKGLLESVAEGFGFPTEVSLVPDPDRVLSEPGENPEIVAATSDSAILNQCGVWVNLASYLLATVAPGATVLDLAAG